MKRFARWSLAAALTVPLWLVASADGHDHGADDDASGGVAVSPVLVAPIEEVGGKFASMVRVTLAPGAVSEPHRHPGTVLVYVLEGEVQSALDDGAEETFQAGGAWKEHPGALHRVARNTGDAPAVLLAILIHDDGDALQLPAE